MASHALGVLVVDDSATCRLALRHVLESRRELRVVGEASTGAAAKRAIQRLRPDLVTMDVHLGDDDGIQVTAEIMSSHATPILVVTGVDPHDPDLVFRAMAAGALDVCPKPPAPGAADWDSYAKHLTRVARALAGVPVVTRRARRAAGSRTPPPVLELAPRRIPALAAPPRACGLVAIGASTGGPPLLRALLCAVPAPCAVPIAIAQHIASGFVESLATWLRDESGHDVVVCDERESLRAGRVYLAADDCHLALLGPNEIGSVSGPPRLHQRPSVDELFESAAKYLGAAAAGVLATGMGSDGSTGLARLRACGATTIAQSPDSCVVSSMPARAIERGAASWVLSPPEIAGAIQTLAGRAGTAQ